MVRAICLPRQPFKAAVTILFISAIIDGSKHVHSLQLPYTAAVAAHKGGKQTIRSVLNFERTVSERLRTVFGINGKWIEGREKPTESVAVIKQTDSRHKSTSALEVQGLHALPIGAVFKNPHSQGGRKMNLHRTVNRLVRADISYHQYKGWRNLLNVMRRKSNQMRHFFFNHPEGTLSEVLLTLIRNAPRNLGIVEEAASHSESASRLALALGPQLEPVPKPTPWPKQLYCQLFQNRTGNLAIVDLWYDWKRGGNMNIIRSIGGNTLYDVEWNNGTSYYFDLEAEICKTISFPVGILRPDWLAGASYLGRESVGGVECNVFSKAEFITYYEDVQAKVPVKWQFFTGAIFTVLKFEAGRVLDDQGWQAPQYCFEPSTRMQV
eukprot:jgi/Mesen1/8036/ME000428S07240